MTRSHILLLSFVTGYSSVINCFLNKCPEIHSFSQIVLEDRHLQSIKSNDSVKFTLTECCAQLT